MFKQRQPTGFSALAAQSGSGGGGGGFGTFGQNTTSVPQVGFGTLAQQQPQQQSLFSSFSRMKLNFFFDFFKFYYLIVF